MIIPTIHLNDTPGVRLLEQVCDAANAVSNALGNLCESTPNARDYYPQGNEAFYKARDEHDARCAKLREVRDELRTLAEEISNAIDAREGAE